MSKEFEGQHDDEVVIFTFRNHMITMRKGFYALLIPFLVASIPILIWPENLTYLWVAFGGLALGLLLFFYHWMGWYFSLYIVTNQRLRQITQKGFFDKSVIDLGVSKIQNISYNVPGFTAAMLGYGTVVVQTYVGDLFLNRVHHPGKIYNDLAEVIKKYGSETTTFNEEDTA